MSEGVREGMEEGGSKMKREGGVRRSEGSSPLRNSSWCGGSRAHSCCWDEDVGCDCCEASW